MSYYETVQAMINLIKRHPKKRYIYAVTGGIYLGELLVYMDASQTDYCFLSLPIMKNRLIPREKFDFGISEKVVDVIEKLPRKVYNVCKAQFTKNIKDGNTLENI